MEYRNLGNTGLFLSELSYGSWETFSTKLNLHEAKELMAHAYDNGINFFDNAETYADGLAEEMMGQAIKELGWDRSSFVVSSKVFWGGSQPTQMGLSRKHVIEAANGALKRFNLDYIDLFYCHRPDKDTALIETIRAMDTLIKQGKILYWGTSEWDSHLIEDAFLLCEKYNLTPPSMEQPQYNLFEREKIELSYSYLFEDHNLGTTTWSPLSSGILTGKYLEGVPTGSRLSLKHLSWLQDFFLKEKNDQAAKVKKLEKLSKSLEMTLAQFSIAWCLKNQNVSSVILGASKISQLEENLKASELKEKLTSEVLAEVDKIVGLPTRSEPAPIPQFKDF